MACEGEWIGFEQSDQVSHKADGVDSKMRHRAVGRLSESFQSQPKHTLLGNVNVQAGRLTNDDSCAIGQGI